MVRKPSGRNQKKQLWWLRIVATLKSQGTRYLAFTVNSAISHHEKFKNAFFFQPPSSASGRRSYEKYHSITIKFIYAGIEYEYWCDVSCTCRYVEYHGGFSVGDETKDVRAFKKIRSELENAIANYKGGKND